MGGIGLAEGLYWSAAAEGREQNTAALSIQGDVGRFRPEGGTFGFSLKCHYGSDTCAKTRCFCAAVVSLIIHVRMQHFL